MSGNKGNILFLILIAVALFSALSYTLTRSGRTPSSTIEKEKAKLTQAQINICESQVNTAKNRLQLMSGCTESRLSFELPDGTNENPNNPSDTSCFIFHPDGGGIAPCGGYTEAIVTTGQITAVGDTTTIVAIAAGNSYIRCNSYGGSGHCFTNYSDDGVNFYSNATLCLRKGDGSDPSRTASIILNYGNQFCSSACGGSYNGNATGGAGAISHYLEDDYSITPYTGPCNLSGLSNYLCDCW
jgi:hypothetical protein